MMILAAFGWDAFFFMLFALISCAFALGVLFSTNIVRMAFYLTMSLGATAGLFFLAGAEFVGAMQLMIYVGGTLVLLIFGVMLTAQSRFVSLKTSGGEWVMAVILGSGLFLLLLQTALSVADWRTPHPADRLAVAATALDEAVAGLEKIEQVATDEGRELSSGQAGRMLDRQRAVADDLANLPRQVGDVAPAVETALAQAADHREQVEQLLEGIRSEGATEASLRSLGIAAADAVSQLRAARASVGQALRQVAVPLEESKTTTQIGLAFAGARVDVPGESGYLMPFVIVSVHLLVVLVGAAYMARTKRRASPAERP